MISSVSSADVIGIDIGGANLKLCTSRGDVAHCTFPMWTDYRTLADRLSKLALQLCPQGLGNISLAITMTGELADCFETRRQGVATIVKAVLQMTTADRCHVYSVDGQWLTIQQAIDNPWQVAASNWHALAAWCIGQLEWAHNIDLLLDVGSTTVDVIPIRNGKIATAATTDRQRLQLGQLVYTGIQRTPVHAILDRFQMPDGQNCPVMAERFATAHDAYLILRELPEQADNCESADGRPLTRPFAIGRLARMIGEDAETIDEGLALSMAEQVAAAQVRQVTAAIMANLPPGKGSCCLLTSGHGQPLTRRLQRSPELCRHEFRSLDDVIGTEAARCAPALAVARLWYGRSNGT
jgi:hypothetical protein